MVDGQPRSGIDRPRSLSVPARTYERARGEAEQTAHTLVRQEITMYETEYKHIETI